MGRYLLHRLGYSLLTIAGVMVITFVLFRVVAGDIPGAWLGPKATTQARADWSYRHGYDKPLLVNLHDRLIVRDLTVGEEPLSVSDVGGSAAAARMALVLSAKPRPVARDAAQKPLPASPPQQELASLYIRDLSPDAPVTALTGGKSLLAPPKPPAAAPVEDDEAGTRDEAAAAPTSEAAAPAPAAAAPAEPAIVLSLSDGSKLTVPIAGIETVSQLVERLSADPRLSVEVSQWNPLRTVDSQFFHHLKRSVTFEAQSLDTGKTLGQIIRERGPYSLALSVPALGIEWLIALVIASVVAYYRGSWLDHVGVLLSVIGMCIPFLAFMMYGQQVMFKISPAAAFGIAHRTNLYLPIAIMVIAGLGGMVRFYRTVILDETGRDYVRTARAKGVPLPRILFVHVLRNCMLPILTNLVMTIPFLIMGNLLLEKFFGIPGLGDLMITSITSRDEPVINALVFLTALIYTLGILVTDLMYSIMDPRIRLR